MNVNNIGQIQKPHFRISETAVSKSDSNAAESASGAKRDLSTIKSSKLLDSVKPASSKERESLVAEIKTKLNDGYFESRQAAEKVADSILDS